MVMSGTMSLSNNVFNAVSTAKINALFLNFLSHSIFSSSDGPAATRIAGIFSISILFRKEKS